MSELVTSIAGLYAAELHNAGGSSTPLGGVIQQDIATGTTIDGEPTSGSVDVWFQSLSAQDPTLDLGTRHIATWLNNIGITGLAVAEGATEPGLNLFAQEHADGSSRKTGANHRKYTAAKCFVYPKTLRCEHRQNAVLEYGVVVLYDGTNDPIVFADSSALVSGVTDAERFTLGPIELESVTIDHVKSFSIDFGLQLSVQSAGSSIWPSFVSIEQRQLELRIEGVDKGWLAAAKIPLVGKNATHTNTAIYLRKRASGSTFVADATAEHISFTAAGLAVIDNAFSAGGNSPATCSLRMPLRYDGTNAPLVIDTTAALP